MQHGGLWWQEIGFNQGWTDTKHCGSLQCDSHQICLPVGSNDSPCQTLAYEVGNDSVNDLRPFWTEELKNLYAICPLLGKDCVGSFYFPLSRDDSGGSNRPQLSSIDLIKPMDKPCNQAANLHGFQRLLHITSLTLTGSTTHFFLEIDKLVIQPISWVDLKKNRIQVKIE